MPIQNCKINLNVLGGNTDNFPLLLVGSNDVEPGIFFGSLYFDLTFVNFGFGLNDV